MDKKKIFKLRIQDSKKLLENLFDSQNKNFEKFIEIVLDAIKNNKTIFWCGNGGSAAESSHMAAELIGRYHNKRRSIKSLSLNADTAVLTCISNDFGFNQVFSRQLEALAEAGDVLIVLSTSGQSKNIIEALETSKKMNLCSIALLGGAGGRAAEISNLVIRIDSSETARIQEMHLLLGHILCEYIDEYVTN